MSETIRYWVGIDAHSGSHVAAVAPAGSSEVVELGRFAGDGDGLLRRLRRYPAGSVSACYEAGPLGYWLQRRLTAAGIACAVIAPSLIPRSAGERARKTDRRDAVKLARLWRSGDLTAVVSPDPAHEAVRELSRGRGAAVSDVVRARQRLAAFLLRHDKRYAGKAWTGKHRTWLAGLSFEHAASRRWLELSLTTLDEACARRDAMTAALEEAIAGWSLGWQVEALRALRGIGPVVAATLSAELGDLRRFSRPGELMSYVGLISGERSSDQRRITLGITRTGNRRARTALVEAAWSYARATKAIPPRPEVPAALALIAAKAQVRLSRRFRHLTRHGKRSTLAITAIARELAGFAWHIAHSARPG